MALAAAVGQASAIDGKEAGAQAARQALAALEREPAALAFVFASGDYPIPQVLSGIAPVVGETPLFGWSTAHEISSEGVSERSVVVALLAGDDIQARAAWWPDFAQDSRAATRKMLEAFEPWEAYKEPTLLMALDGLGGDFDLLGGSLHPGAYTVGGGLSAGRVHTGRTFQIGGTQVGSGGLAAAVLNGELITGVGHGHGWHPIGASFRVTRADGPWVRTLDDKTPAEAYAALFGHDSRDWSFPPLNELIRLYPLGVESAPGQDLVVRSPLRVESDGSLRMSSPVPEGTTCHLLVGSADNCVTAATHAARSAMGMLYGATPALGLVLTDISWPRLMEAEPERAVRALQAEIGAGVPLAGGDSFGQVVRSAGDSATQLLNQNIEIILFATKQPEN